MFVVNLRPTGMRIHFEAFTFDDGAHELRRAGEPVEISPKAFVLLGLLLAGRPRVMSHVDLRDRLWPDSHVARTSLARLVTEIRHALGDEAGTPRFVRNVHGLGYAFCGEAHAEPGAIAPGEPSGAAFPCGLLWGAHEIGLREGQNLIGRTPDCAVRIDSPQVSRHHARILIHEGQATVEDLGSKNGTFVEGARLDGPRRLKDGENVCVGPALLIFREGYGPGSTKTG
jgi:DNA-binding winged helix-turn-helix (wHTH) protein